MGEVRLSFGPAGCGKTRLAVGRFLDALTHSDPAELLWDARPRFLFLVPDAEGARSVRRALLAEPKVGGLTGPSVLSFNGLYELIFQLAGRSSPQPLSDVARLTLLRRVLRKLAHEDALRLFGKWAPAADPAGAGPPLYRRPGFVRALDGFIQELKQGAKEPADFSRALDAFGRDDRSRDLEAVYASYQKTLTEPGLYDAAGVSWYARDLLPAAVQGFSTLALLVVDGFLTFTPTQLAILKELAGRSAETLVTLTYEDDPGRRELYYHTARTYELLREHLHAVPEAMPPSDARPATLWHLERDLFRWEHRGTVEANRDELRLLEAPGDSGEALAVAREAKSLITTGYCLPEEMLILCRSRAHQVPALVRACAQLGVPLQAKPWRSLLQVPVVTALLKALRVAAEDWPRELVSDALSSPYLRLGGGGLEVEVDVEAIAGEALIVGGREHWFDRLERLTQALSQEARRGSEDAEEAPELSRRRRRRASKRAEACTLVQKRATALATVLEGIPAEATIEEFVASARRLIENLGLRQSVVGGNADATKRDVTALGHLDEVLTDLTESLPASATRMNLAEFLGELASALGETLLQEGPASSEAVRVMEVHEARGIQAPVVFVVGLREGLFPRAAAVRPFYGEREREQLNAHGLGLEQEDDVECREVFLFYTAVTRATRRLYLTHPATDSRGKTQLRSHFLDEVEELLSEPASCRQRVGLVDWPPTLAKAACPEELLERWTSDASQQPGRPGADLLAAHALLAQETPRALEGVWDGAAQIRHREGPEQLSSYDGVLGEARTKSLLAEEFSAQRLYSASQFDQYARCPFAFYLKYLLGVQPPPEAPERMEPLEIGALCHQALAQVHRRCAQAGKPARDNLVYAQGVLKEVVEQLFGDELLARLGVGRALGDVYRSETLELLEPTLSVGPDGDFLPRHFEIAFGHMRGDDVNAASRAEPLSLDIGRESVLVRGRIDRVDAAAGSFDLGPSSVDAERDSSGLGPGSFVILDYKLGETPGVRALREGRHVQLALYLVAAEEVLFPGRRCEAAGFVSLSQAKASFPIRREAAKQAIGGEEAGQLARQYVRAYVHAMRQGLFPPLPADDRACSMCPFAPCCRREHARVERKLGSSGRAGLLRLPAAEEGARG